MNNRIMSANTANTIKRITEVLNHIKKYPTEAGILAKKSFSKTMFIRLIVIMFLVLPIMIGTLLPSMIDMEARPSLPVGATKEVTGHISKYESTFWYTNNSQKYEYEISRYPRTRDFKPGETFIIYIDDNNNIVSIKAKSNDENKEIFIGIKIILMFVISIGILVLERLVGKKTYSLSWNLYYEWYEKEIYPHRGTENFEYIQATKSYHNMK